MPKYLTSGLLSMGTSIIFHNNDPVSLLTNQILKKNILLLPGRIFNFSVISVALGFYFFFHEESIGPHNLTDLIQRYGIFEFLHGASYLHKTTCWRCPAIIYRRRAGRRTYAEGYTNPPGVVILLDY